MVKKRGAAKPRTDIKDLSGVLPRVDHIPLIEVDIDDEWRQRCVDAIARLRMPDGTKLRQKDVAAWVGMVQSNWSETFNLKIPTDERPKRCSFVERICAALDVEIPKLAELYLVARRMNDVDPSKLDDAIRRLRTQLDWSRPRN